jgi:hypothetical protein
VGPKLEANTKRSRVNGVGTPRIVEESGLIYIVLQTISPEADYHIKERQR